MEHENGNVPLCRRQKASTASALSIRGMMAQIDSHQGHARYRRVSPRTIISALLLLIALGASVYWQAQGRAHQQIDIGGSIRQWRRAQLPRAGNQHL